MYYNRIKIHKLDPYKILSLSIKLLLGLGDKSESFVGWTSEYRSIHHQWLNTPLVVIIGPSLAFILSTPIYVCLLIHQFILSIINLTTKLNET